MQDTSDTDLRQQIIQLQEQVAALEADSVREKGLAAEIAERLNLSEAMLDIVPVGVVVANVDGAIVLGNAAIEKMLRHPVLHSADAESYGEWISYHADGRRVQSHEYPLAKVITEGADFAELDVNYLRGDKTSFWMRIISQPVRDKQGQRIGAVVALVDVDRERQLAVQQELLIGELNHRVKNAFSVVKSIVSMSLRKENIPDGLRTKIDRRLDAYAKAHAKLVGSEWDHAELSTIVDDIVITIGADRISCDGPVVDLPSRQALAISMAFYELATNATKYGSLSVPDGMVALTWQLSQDGDHRKISISWSERDGPETVVPTDKGFGSFIINQALAIETGGSVDMSYAPRGFEWRLEMPLN